MRATFLTCLFVLTLGFAGLALTPWAHAQTNPGCNPEFTEAAKARADMLRLRNSCVMKQLLPPRASVLELTCFDRAALYAASTGGSIFSGNFSLDVHFLAVVVRAAQRMSQDNFFDNILDDIDLSQVLTTAVFQLFGLNRGYRCKYPLGLWKGSTGQGFNEEAPLLTLDEVANGAVGPAGDRFKDCLDAVDGGQDIVARYLEFFGPDSPLRGRVPLPSRGQLRNATSLEQLLDSTKTFYTPGPSRL